MLNMLVFFFFSSRRRHTRWNCDWSSDVCSSDLDRPGVIGTLGRILGEAGVNIAGMQVSRNARGGEALVSLTVDSKVSAELLGQITESIGATWARTADLGD